MAVLRGNLAPRGAIIKQSAATPALLQHTGRAVVFDSVEDMTMRIDSPDLDVRADDVLVLRNAGPIGAPGMPEAGYLPIPKKLATQGVKDMVRLSDARMSGTAFGAIVLHMTPEAALGGPLALVRNGDTIRSTSPAGASTSSSTTPSWRAGAQTSTPTARPARRRRRRAATRRCSIARCCRPTKAATSTFSFPAEDPDEPSPRPRGVIAATATPIDADQRPDLPRLLATAARCSTTAATRSTCSAPPARRPRSASSSGSP